MEHWALIYIWVIFLMDVTRKEQSTLEEGKIKESTTEI